MSGPAKEKTVIQQASIFNPMEMQPYRDAVTLWENIYQNATTPYYRFTQMTMHFSKVFYALALDYIRPLNITSISNPDGHIFAGFDYDFPDNGQLDTNSLMKILVSRPFSEVEFECAARSEIVTLGTDQLKIILENDYRKIKERFMGDVWDPNVRTARILARFDSVPASRIGLRGLRDLYPEAYLETELFLLDSPQEVAEIEKLIEDTQKYWYDRPKDLTPEISERESFLLKKAREIIGKYRYHGDELVPEDIAELDSIHEEIRQYQKRYKKRGKFPDEVKDYIDFSLRKMKILALPHAIRLMKKLGIEPREALYWDTNQKERVTTPISGLDQFDDLAMTRIAVPENIGIPDIRGEYRGKEIVIGIMKQNPWMHIGGFMRFLYRGEEHVVENIWETLDS